MMLINSIISAPDKCYQHISGTSQYQSLGEIRVMRDKNTQVLPIPQSKFCNSCKTEKPYSFFYQHKNKLVGHCKDCIKIKRKEDYAKDPDKINKKNLESHYRNREKRLITAKEYRDKNKEKIANGKKEWYARHKHDRGTLRTSSKEDVANYYKTIIDNKFEWKSKYSNKEYELTRDVLKELLDYDSDTGVFIWKVNKATKAVKGQVAGCEHNGYRTIKINNKSYFAHRLAWLYVYGKLPNNEIDHINGDGLDNKIGNLREANRSQNMQNLRHANKNNKLGLTGVYKKDNKYVASITINGHQKFLGSFNCALEAHAEYLKFKRAFHEFCTV
jgi:HNH endonuclease